VTVVTMGGRERAAARVPRAGRAVIEKDFAFSRKFRSK
jgi:hypothetical protein